MVVVVVDGRRRRRRQYSSRQFYPSFLSVFDRAIGEGESRVGGERDVIEDGEGGDGVDLQTQTRSRSRHLFCGARKQGRLAEEGGTRVFFLRCSFSFSIQSGLEWASDGKSVIWLNCLFNTTHPFNPTLLYIARSPRPPSLPLSKEILIFVVLSGFLPFFRRHYQRTPRKRKRFCSTRN